MATKRKNWKLITLGLIFVGIFVSLGIWQLSRAEQKESLLNSLAARTKHAPYSAEELNNPRDWRFYRAELKGNFDNQHTFLLDNKTYQGKIGYEVYTLFIAKDLAQPILIDRGFIPITSSRAILPTIIPITETVVITGMLNLPPTYVAMGKITDSAKISWPLRVEYIQLNQITNLLNTSALFPYVLMIDPKSPHAFAIDWQIFPMSPERHRGYAVQWFALALTLLILSVVLNRTSK